MESSESLAGKVTSLLAENVGVRICSFEFQGKKYWLKQAEILTGAMRWLKDDPQASLLVEQQALEELYVQGAAVPKIAMAGEGFIVIEDAGQVVSARIAHSKIPNEQAKEMLVGAAKALAQLHSQALTHGRPALRDISWQHGKATFIDFEAKQSGASDKLKQRDLLVFIHSLYRYIKPENPYFPFIAEAIHCYRDAGGEAIWQGCQQRIKPWQWLNFIIAPIMPFAGKDLRPIYWLFKHFKG